MKMNKLILLISINLIITYTKVFGVNDKQFENDLKSNQIKNLNFANTNDHKYEASYDCHRLALSTCGHTLIKIFKFLDYLSPKEAFYSKCTLKNVFYNCLKKTKAKSCSFKKRRDHLDYSKLKTKLAQVLWSTKACLLVPLYIALPPKKNKLKLD